VMQEAPDLVVVDFAEAARREALYVQARANLYAIEQWADRQTGRLVVLWTDDTEALATGDNLELNIIVARHCSSQEYIAEWAKEKYATEELSRKEALATTDSAG